MVVFLKIYKAFGKGQSFHVLLTYITVITTAKDYIPTHIKPDLSWIYLSYNILTVSITYHYESKSMEPFWIKLFQLVVLTAIEMKTLVFT